MHSCLAGCCSSTRSAWCLRVRCRRSGLGGLRVVVGRGVCLPVMFVSVVETGRCAFGQRRGESTILICCWNEGGATKLRSYLRGENVTEWKNLPPNRAKNCGYFDITNSLGQFDTLRPISRIRRRSIIQPTGEIHGELIPRQNGVCIRGCHGVSSLPRDGPHVISNSNVFSNGSPEGLRVY